MPYPLGHTAIGLTTYEINGQKVSPSKRVWMAFYILLLSNLPDFDMLAGLLVAGNGSLFHRGPSHSLLFAVLMGYLTSRAAKRLGIAQPFGFGLCTSLILSHVVADMIFTDAPVSLFWPFEVNFVQGNYTLGDVFHGILFKSLGDLGIFFGCVAIIGLTRYLRSKQVIRRVLPFKFQGLK